MTNDQAPPSHLSPRAQAIWRAIAPTRARSPGRLVLLRMALEQLDVADAAREQVQREGTTFTTKRTGAIHQHPALIIEKQARTSFLRIWAQLGLSWDAEIDGIVTFG